jgi:hypothetical protein
VRNKRSALRRMEAAIMARMLPQPGIEHKAHQAGAAAP